MWGFESLLPCQFLQGRERTDDMAQAAKLNREETGGEGASFQMPGFVERLLEYPKRLRQFLHEVRNEMRLVNWPSRQDVWSTTIVVIVTVTFFGIYFLLTDSVLQRAVGWLISYGKSH